MKKDITNKLEAKSYDNPCVIFSNGIGDHFLVLPTIRALSYFFKGNLTLICEKYSFAKEIFYGIKFKKIIGIRFWEEDVGRRFDSQLLLNEINDCDLLISLNPWGEDLDITDLLKSLKLKKSVGFYKRFELAIPFDLKKHNIDLNFDIAKSIDSSLNIDHFTYPPIIGEDFNILRERLSKKIPDSIKLLALHTDTKEDKMWRNEGYLEVLEKIIEKYPNIGIVIVGEESINVENSAIRDNVLFFSETTLPFRIACAIVSISNFFLGIDSVFLHVADFYRIPTVGLFGPTSDVEFGSKFSENENIQAKEGDISKITEIEVLKALNTIIINMS